MDWNNDGKHDHQDHSFYNNVINSEDKSSTSFYSKSTNSKKSCNNDDYSSDSSGKGWIWFIVFCVVYVLVKLIVQ